MIFFIEGVMIRRDTRMMIFSGNFPEYILQAILKCPGHFHQINQRKYQLNQRKIPGGSADLFVICSGKQHTLIIRVLQNRKIFPENIHLNSSAGSSWGSLERKPRGKRKPDVLQHRAFNVKLLKTIENKGLTHPLYLQVVFLLTLILFVYTSLIFVDLSHH